MRTRWVVVALTLAALSASTRAQDRVTTTSHPPLPAAPSQYWLVADPSASTSSARRADSGPSQLARGVALIEEEKFAAALPVVTGAQVAATPLAHYGRYYTAVALLELGRVDDAEAILTALDDRVEGYLKEAVPLRMAEAALARGDAARAADILDDLSDETLTAPEEVLVRLGAALDVAGESEKALAAYRRVYYEYPLSTAGVGRTDSDRSS